MEIKRYWDNDIFFKKGKVVLWEKESILNEPAQRLLYYEEFISNLIDWLEAKIYKLKWIKTVTNRNIMHIDDYFGTYYFRISLMNGEISINGEKGYELDKNLITKSFARIIRANDIELIDKPKEEILEDAESHYYGIEMERQYHFHNDDIWEAKEEDVDFGVITNFQVKALEKLGYEFLSIKQLIEDMPKSVEINHVTFFKNNSGIVKYKSNTGQTIEMMPNEINLVNGIISMLLLFQTERLKNEKRQSPKPKRRKSILAKLTRKWRG